LTAGGFCRILGAGGVAAAFSPRRYLILCGKLSLALRRSVRASTVLASPCQLVCGTDIDVRL
jgi:hypothetical protein